MSDLARASKAAGLVMGAARERVASEAAATKMAEKRISIIG